MPEAPTAPPLLDAASWQARRSAHEQAVDELTAAHLDRRRHGQAHPIIDFLFTYYRSSVGALRRWHPGPDVALEVPSEPAAPPRFYRPVRIDGRHAVTLDLEALRDAKGKRWQRAATLISRTADRPGRLSCFGLHEWAMVYRLRPEQIRHSQVPLRVSPELVAEQVESGVRCTHFDAFRFFTPPAEPLNEVRLTRATQLDHEQPACLHAGMDLYRWAAELGPGCPGDLALDCFRAAVRARIVDMQASPYDLREYGYDPIPIETAAGRAEYVAFQRRWIAQTNELRQRLLEVYARLGVTP